MTVKLRIEQHSEFLSLKGGCVHAHLTHQNATFLESSCRGSNYIHAVMTDEIAVENWMERQRQDYNSTIQL